MVFKGASAVGLPILELTLEPAMPVQEDTGCFGVDAIISILF